MKINKSRKGFTLIELLVVIAIIAILSVVVILTLNPAELLRQSRDANRVTDMATLKSAISLYLADVSSPSLAATTACAIANPAYNCEYYSIPTAGLANGNFATASSGIQSISTQASTTGNIGRGIDASGWLPVNLSLISAGSPIGNLPVDPTNSTTSLASFGAAPLMYGYIATSSGGLTFKITSHMESSKYAGGSGDVEGVDGGLSATTYEVGTALKL